jgi:hypothetical protein
MWLAPILLATGLVAQVLVVAESVREFLASGAVIERR